MQNLLCSAVCLAGYEEHYSHFRFPIRRSAHKPSTQRNVWMFGIHLLGKTSRVSSLTWSNPRQGFFIALLNRAIPAHNTCAPQRRMAKRIDNQRRVVETGTLKEECGSFCHGIPSVNHPCVKGRGFRLVKVEPRDSKSSELVPRKRRFKHQKSQKGFCMQPTEPRKPSIQ